MKTKLIKEAVMVLITLLPTVYLAMIWNTLPAKVPMHYDLEGNIDRYGSKTELLIVTLALPLSIYLIMLAVPFLDPKKRIQQMGAKYDKFKLVLVIFMSGLSMIVVYSSQSEHSSSPDYVFALIGVLFTVLGNYFQALKPNYFIGIRTPWTLENEEVWKSTHHMAGRLWLAGGLVLAFAFFVMPDKLYTVLFMSMTGVLAVVPIVYSFIKFRQIKNQGHRS